MHQYTTLAPGEYYGTSRGALHDSGCAFLERYYPPEIQLPWHHHEVPFLCLLVSGSYSECYGRNDILHQAGSVVFHPPGESHQTSMGFKGGEVFLIEIGELWVKMMNQLPGKVSTRFEIADTPLSWLATQIRRESAHNHQSSLLIESFMAELLARTMKTEKPRFAPGWLHQVMDFLGDCWRRSFTIKELAGQMGIHPFHLARVFRKFNGASIGEYVHRLRIDSAKTRLRQNSAIRLCDLAIDLGFADQSHFTRTFKKFTGSSPGSYARSLEAGIPFSRGDAPVAPP